MTKVILHGPLAKAVGRSVWMLAVKTPQEALRAIEANSRKLLDFLRTDNNGETPYHVILDSKPVDGLDQMIAPVKTYQTIEFVPVIAGAGGGGVLAIVGIAMVLIAISIFTWGMGTPALLAGGPAVGALFGGATSMVAFSLLTLGASLALSGISSMLTPQVKQVQPNEPSYLFDGPQNTTRQGLPVPIGYGELIVGSATISSGITSAAIPITPYPNT